MNKLLELSISGIKNIENLLTINFANETIEKDIKNLNNVKGIFGYNGAGKSAIISAVDIYKKIICDTNYLLQNDTVEKLMHLVNFNTKKLFISMIFEHNKGIVIKHSIQIEKNKTSDDYIITEENLSLSAGRTLNEKYKSVINKNNGDIYIDPRYDSEELNFIKINNTDYISLLQLIIKNVVSVKLNSESSKKITDFEKIIMDYFLCILNIEVYLADSDKHNIQIINKKTIDKLYCDILDAKAKSIIGDWIDINPEDDIVNKNDLELYEKENNKLIKFIKIFKPEVININLIKTKDKNEIYHIKKEFVYKDYNVDFEFESTGIKQLVTLFSYLAKCANGCTVFIDEIDTNINAVYFEKMILFFKEYGKGQLIFTSHNIESMNALKSQKKSIVVLGAETKIDTWVPIGNKSPVSCYFNGDFENSPMNVEDFDFINAFFDGE